MTTIRIHRGCAEGAAAIARIDALRAAATSTSRRWRLHPQTPPFAAAAAAAADRA